MHPRRSAQKILLCDLCKIVPLQSHCELCHINLCVNCVGKHISDPSKRHKVVHHLQRKSTPNYPKCSKHAEKRCELHCEKCDVPLCITCVSSGKHEGHKLSEFLEKLRAKTQSLQQDLEELENRIFPRYEGMVSDIHNEKAELEKNYEKLTKDADQQGEILHREVTAIVNRRKSDIQEMKNKHISSLNKNTEEIMQKSKELNQIIANLKSILKSKDVFSYKSRNSEFRRLPPKVRATLPSFSPRKINKDQLNAMFGSLSSISITKEYGDTTEAGSSPTVKTILLDEPRLTATTDTDYNELYNVSCLSEGKVWACGDSKNMKLFNVQGKQLSSIQTKSGYVPQDIAMTQGGDLVYTDYDSKTVNLVKNIKIRTVITLQGWVPRYICSTASDDLLVTMSSDDREQSKVVRYSGSTPTQTIQFDDQARPLYSSGLTKYISENKNRDICVADRYASAIVVVNQSGKFRFKYTGHPSNTKESFDPVGIATDSLSHILTADIWNCRIHILDQDGQFLCYIHDLDGPRGLCIDNRDNLFVAELHTAKVKKIQYLESQC